MIRKAVWSQVLILVLAGAALAGSRGPEIKLIDGKLSIHAETVPLGRLLAFLDRATGLQSKVPAELANRNVSVIFTDLTMQAGIRKIFEGMNVDWAFVGGSGITVTSVSQVAGGPLAPVGGGNEPAPNPFAQPFTPVEQPFMNNEDQQPAQIPNIPAMQQVPGQAPFANPFGQQPQPPQSPGNAQFGQQPATIQTPFGPIPNPRANQPFGAQPGAPMAAPGQPFGSTPFGNPGTDLFGNTSPQILGSPTPGQTGFGGGPPPFGVPPRRP